MKVLRYSLQSVRSSRADAVSPALMRVCSEALGARNVGGFLLQSDYTSNSASGQSF